ncbi:hypothetical protein K8R03_01910 [Candidatus Kaiserbacteria bacterium]|nr:hypothetical protein [Candidatus Kaiserbacteria bacterium]
MGSLIEINDTLQITKEQGFPSELDIESHLLNPYAAESFTGRVFEFTNKPNIRVYQSPPVRNFLVENKNGKWIYWGLIHVVEVVHNSDRTTSGKFEIIYIYTPDEMRKAHDLIDRNDDTRYFI